MALITSGCGQNHAGTIAIAVGGFQSWLDGLVDDRNGSTTETADALVARGISWDADGTAHNHNLVISAACFTAFL